MKIIIKLSFILCVFSCGRAYSQLERKIYGEWYMCREAKNIKDTLFLSRLPCNLKEINETSKKFTFKDIGEFIFSLNLKDSVLKNKYGWWWSEKNKITITPIAEDTTIFNQFKISYADKKKAILVMTGNQSFPDSLTYDDTSTVTNFANRYSNGTGSYGTDSTIWRAELIPILDSLVKCRKVESEFIGIGGIDSKTYALFKKLQLVATDKELIQLTDFKNPTVKVYSFWALARKHNKSVKDILLKHIKDDEEFDYMSGCEIMGKEVNSFFLDILTPNYIDISCLKLSKKEVKKFENLIKNE